MSGCWVACRKRDRRSRGPQRTHRPRAGPKPSASSSSRASPARPPAPRRLARLRRTAPGTRKAVLERLRESGVGAGQGQAQRPGRVQPLDHALRTGQGQLPHAARLLGQAAGDRTGREALRRAARVRPRRSPLVLHPPPKPEAAASTWFSGPRGRGGAPQPQSAAFWGFVPAAPAAAVLRVAGAGGGGQEARAERAPSSARSALARAGGAAAGAPRAPAGSAHRSARAPPLARSPVGAKSGRRRAGHGQSRRGPGTFHQSQRRSWGREAEPRLWWRGGQSSRLCVLCRPLAPPAPHCRMRPCPRAIGRDRGGSKAHWNLSGG